MTDLLEHAKTLATEPPSAVYKKLMELFSQAQLATLGDPPTSDPDGTKTQIYNQSKQEYESIADKWGQMIEQGYGIAQFSVTAICDFVAMCMMMIAAGSARSEGLKTAIRGQRSFGIFETKLKDRAYLIKRGNSKQFHDAMETWCGLKNNGIVQFKFSANDDFHTFAVERAPDQKEQPEFIVYQSYQNTYSLSHFLKLRGVWNDNTLIKVHQRRWGALSQGEKNVYRNSYTVYKQSLIPEMQNIEIAMNWIGAGQRLTYEDLCIRVLEPLEIMLDGTTSHPDYVRMTGSPSTSKTFKMPFMIMLMCDQVSPNQFEANRRALYGCPSDLTTYAECGLK